MENAICTIGIKVKFPKKANNVIVLRKVDEWLLFGSLKPRFKSSNRRNFSNQLPGGACWISEKTQDHITLTLGTRWSIRDRSDTFAAQNQCDANKLGHAGSADSGTGEQKCHPSAKNENSSQFSLMHTYDSLF